MNIPILNNHEKRKAKGMDVQRFKEVIQKRDNTDDEYDYGVEVCDKEEIEILSEDVPSTVAYLKNDCTPKEFFLGQRDH